MRVLHIGWGFEPWRGGGLIEYAEDLMDIQRSKGWEVSYFFSGRHYPFLKGPKLVKWRRNGIMMYEVLNSPIIHSGGAGTLRPDLDLKEAESEAFFRRVINKVKPDIVHIQELAGLPSSLVDIIKDEYALPVIMTLQDYFLLCPTLKLFDCSRKNCLNLKDIECDICCTQEPITDDRLFRQTFAYELKKHHLDKIAKCIYRLVNFFPHTCTKNALAVKKIPDPLFREAFQKRRKMNIQRLRKIGNLLAQSHKVEEIYRDYLGNEVNITTLRTTVKHTEYIEPKKRDTIDLPIRFAVLNGCISIAKGAGVILDALEILSQKDLLQKFQLHIFGGLDEDLSAKILSFLNVTYHGAYKVNELNNFLRKIDVGIMPSIWEESFGYTGIEFLAKGIPLIGNKRGGIIDYVVENSTGWINQSASGAELAEIMLRLIDNPNAILELNHRIFHDHARLIKTMEQHFLEIEEAYKTVIGSTSE